MTNEMSACVTNPVYFNLKLNFDQNTLPLPLSIFRVEGTAREKISKLSFCQTAFPLLQKVIRHQLT